MILAVLEQPWGGIVAGAIALPVLVCIALLILKGIRGFGESSIQSQSRMLADVTISTAPRPGLVEVVFHTYSGLFLFTHQVEYRFWATPADARTVLARLHRYNLTHGFFAYGALVIPLLSLGNYWAQKRRIAQQEALARR